VAALLLTTVGGVRGKASVALAADLLLAVVLTSEDLERGIDGTTTQTKDQMESGLLLDVVVSESTAVLELLASEDQALLIRGDTLLVLDLSLHSLDGVRRLHIKGDRLTGQGLDEDLHNGNRSEKRKEANKMVVIYRLYSLTSTDWTESECTPSRADAYANACCPD
jgi:hypothetical protein